MFLNKKIINGLDIGNYSVKFVSLIYDKGTLELRGAAYRKLPKNIVEKGVITEKEFMQNIVQNLMNKLDLYKGKLVTAVGNEFIIVRNLNIPHMESAAIKETLRWKFAQFLPFSAEKAIVDYIIRKRSEKEIDLTAVIVSQEVVNRYLETFKKFDLKTLNIQPVALLNIFRLKKIKDIIMIIDIGVNSSTIIVGNYNIIFLVRNLKIGTTQLTKIISNCHSQENVATINEESRLSQYLERISNGQKYFDELVKEIKRVLRFYKRNNNSGHTIENIFLTGGGAYINNLKDQLVTEIKLPVKIIKPFNEVNWSKNDIKNTYNLNGAFTEYAVALGLCLSEVFAIEN